jgi:MarR family transcriptional regulator, negative regulator of the multidrug operon emrRAB
MHSQAAIEANRGRAANLLGALATEAARVQDEVTRAAVGQSGAAAAALVVVAASPGRTVEQLRGPLGLSQPGAARLFERLAASGWIDRGGPGGRRGLQIRLTGAGEAKLRELLAARQAVLSAVLAPLDATELAALSGLLERMLASLTTGRAALERICRLCERGACVRCPVGHALDLRLAADPTSPDPGE